MRCHRRRGMSLAIVIPEPNWWALPQKPISLSRPAGALARRSTLRTRSSSVTASRSTQMTARELRLNGRPFVLRVKRVEPTCSEAQLRDLRAEGINAVITGLEESDGIELWNRADRLGLLVIGYSQPSAAGFLKWKNDLEKHPSALAWAFCQSDLMPRTTGAIYYGVSSADTIFPKDVSFAICHEGDPNAHQETPIPKMMVTKRLSDPMPAMPNVIGWIELPTA